MSDFDAIVVGAGPAGSVTARDLARKGIKTLVIEEHEQVGVPVHCAGVITRRTLDLAGISAGPVLNTLNGAQVHSPTGSTLKLGGNGERALVVDRADLDRMLAEQAAESGATFALGMRVSKMERANGGIRLWARRNGDSLSFSARLVVGADGAHSVVAGHNGDYRPPRAVTLLGAEVELEGTNDDLVHVFLGRDVAPGWFGWMIPIDHKRARVGAGSAYAGLDVRTLLAKLLNSRVELSGARLLKTQGGVVPLVPPQHCYGDNLLLVGDAAGQVNPTSGGGLYPLMVGAGLCAEVAASALERGDSSADTLSEYQRKWDAEMGPEIARERMLRRFFVSLTSEELDGIFETLRREPFRQLLDVYGDIDLQSDTFTRLFNTGLLRGTLRRMPGSLWPKFARLGLSWGARSLRDLAGLVLKSACVWRL
jgi:geranylgeranyl reductase family protein